MENDLSRFIRAQELDYQRALAEIRRGEKKGHWMWYIFPQLRGLGRTSTSQRYGIRDLDEARAYLADPTLGGHLIEICNALLALETDDPLAVMGHPDNLKLCSSMTLFDACPESPDVFQRVLDKFYGGRKDRLTLEMLGMV